MGGKGGGRESFFTVPFPYHQAFTVWINQALRPRGISIADCTKVRSIAERAAILHSPTHFGQDLNTGLVLIALVEQMTGTKCDLPYKANPSNRTFMIDNCNMALQVRAMLHASPPLTWASLHSVFGPLHPQSGGGACRRGRWQRASGTRPRVAPHPDVGQRPQGERVFFLVACVLPSDSPWQDPKEEDAQQSVVKKTRVRMGTLVRIGLTCVR